MASSAASSVRVVGNELHEALGVGGRRHGGDAGHGLVHCADGALARLAQPELLEDVDDAEVVDLRWLDRASLDWETIEVSIRKTNNVIIVEQGARGTSYGGWLADEIQRRCFDWLDQPVQRVTGAEASPSISKVLERVASARTDEVVNGLQQVMRNQGL